MNNYCMVGLLLSAAAYISAVDDIRLPPSLDEGPQLSRYFRSSESFNLNCTGTGTKPLTFRWEKNATGLNIDGSHIKWIQSGVFGSIQIMNGNPSDAGTYQCFISNTYGVTMSDYSVVQMVAIGVFPPTNLAQYTGVDGYDISVPCWSAPSSVPAPIYTWNNVQSSITQPIQTDNRTQLDEKGNLYFANTILTDATPQNSTLECGVFNTLANTQNYGSDSKILIKGLPQNFPPSILFSSPSPVTGIVGKSVSLRCFFRGRPTPTINWRRSPGPLPDTVTYDKSYTELIIHNVRDSDAGVYTCNGSNSQSAPRDHNITLVVGAAPTFIDDGVQLGNVNATNGETVTLTCKTSVNLHANVRWFRDTMEFTADTLPNKYDLSEDSQTLTIPNVCKVCADGTSDLASIQCRANNIYGSAFAQGYLNVLVATKMITEPESRVLQSVVIFPCKAESDKSTPDISYNWFVGDTNTPVTEDEGLNVNEDNSLTINTTEDADGGIARCASYICVATNNNYSYSNVTFELICPVSQAAWWWIPLVVILLLLLLILLLLLLIYCTYYNEGEAYPVDKEERNNGNDPVKDLAAAGFHNFERPRSMGYNLGYNQPQFGTFNSGVSVNTISGNHVPMNPSIGKHPSHRGSSISSSDREHVVMGNPVGLAAPYNAGNWYSRDEVQRSQPASPTGTQNLVPASNLWLDDQQEVPMGRPLSAGQIQFRDDQRQWNPLPPPNWDYDRQSPVDPQWEADQQWLEDPRLTAPVDDFTTSAV